MPTTTCMVTERCTVCLLQEQRDARKILPRYRYNVLCHAYRNVGSVGYIFSAPAISNQRICPQNEIWSEFRCTYTPTLLNKIILELQLSLYAPFLHGSGSSASGMEPTSIVHCDCG
eukprot:gb/GECG01003699.1/.p1 GENE.gb/GECG01003699.1/~~gb/GECG01003699.1/.p1  ORF type:complete len:116 (+),score=0.96 gb/GECG01003699.1/:1-348(+)